MHNILFLAELNEVPNKSVKARHAALKGYCRRWTLVVGVSDNSRGRRNFLSQNIFRIKKSEGSDELGWFIVLGPTDAANKFSHFYCRVCQEDVSVLPHGLYEVLCHYRRAWQFQRDHCILMETRGWCVLDFQRNPLTENVLSVQNEKTRKVTLIVHSQEHPFTRGPYYG